MGPVLRRALAAAGEPAAIRFCLEDRPDLLLAEIGGRSAVAATVRRHPELGRFDTARSLHGVNVRMLTNLGAPGATPAPIEPDLLATVADGIPRSYPFFFACVLLGRVTALPGPELFEGLIPEPDRALTLAGAGAGIDVFTSYRPGGGARRTDLRATYAVAVDLASAELPPTRPETERLLATLGSSRRESLHVRLEVDERRHLAAAQIEARALADVWDRDRDAELCDLTLPHDLPALLGCGEGSGLTSPHKPELLRVFRPHGWRSGVGGPGFLVLERREPWGATLRLEFDVGTWSHKSSCYLDVVGPGWRARFHVPPALGQRGDYPIASPAAWTRLVENTRVVVDHLVKTRVHELRELFPPIPLWFASLPRNVAPE